MARPTKFNEPMTERFSVRLTPEQMQDLEQVAESTNRELMDLWREVLVKTARTMTVTGINSAFVDIGESDVVAEGLPQEDDQPSEAYKVDTSKEQVPAHWKPATAKMLEGQDKRTAPKRAPLEENLNLDT